MKTEFYIIEDNKLHIETNYTKKERILKFKNLEIDDVYGYYKESKIRLIFIDCAIPPSVINLMKSSYSGYIQVIFNDRANQV